jgi:polyvinyl alcohol dehydrogenase (cytochrome)
MTMWSTSPEPCADGRTDCSPAQSGAVTAIPGVVFSGSLDGHLRAYSAGTGKVQWDVDTAREFKTVNGSSAHGGSMDAGGPVVVGGMVFVNSGYGQWGGMPGNVLLAFSVEGR